PVIYCGLMMSSMNAQSRDIGIDATLAILTAGAWSDLQALAHARRHLSIDGLARVSAQVDEPHQSDGFNLALNPSSTVGFAK
ncbi:MAG TPA: hypothetical protein VML75_26980, partial [Kofleriaceae bacterium]|nr:hypothetical protein [Kofleriaceae bacterium]